MDKQRDESLAGLERLWPTCRNDAQRDHVRDFASRLARDWPQPDAATIGRFLALGVGVEAFLVEGGDRKELRQALSEFDALRVRLNVLLRNAQHVLVVNAVRRAAPRPNDEQRIQRRERDGSRTNSPLG